jgi:uncharacterized protein YjdB
MKKKLFAGILLIVGLLLLGGVIYLALHTVVIVPAGKVAVIVPAANITSGTPQVIFIGISTVSPLNLAKYQGVISNVVVTFSEAMDPATVNQNTFMVKGSNNVNINGAITSDATKKVWTFNPTDNLKFNSVYNITVTTGAKGVSGNSLVNNFMWSFTTGSSSGPIAPNVPSGGGSSSTPTPSPVLTTITLSPTSKTLNNGSTQQLTAAGLDQNSAPIAATITYASNNSAVATVNASGFVTAVAAGSAKITATSGAISNTSIIIVVNAGAECPAVTVNLGTAGDFAILSGTGISSTGTTLIVGDIGTGPAVTSTAISGNFALVLDPSNQWSTSVLVTGKVYAYDYAVPTPAKMNTAINDLGTAYTTANGLAPCVTELGAGNIGGMTLSSGVYKWSSGVTIPTDLTLSGNSTDVWVFQIAQNLDIASAKQVKLTGGALAKNVFWIVTGTTTLQADSIFNGNIISGPGTSTIALVDRATLNGRALGQTDVTLIANTVIIPS